MRNVYCRIENSLQKAGLFLLHYEFFSEVALPTTQFILYREGEMKFKFNISTRTRKNMDSNILEQAEISYCVAIVPTAPVKELVAKASLAITEQYSNENIIDNLRFPAHVSLNLGGTDRQLLGILSERLGAVINQFLSKTFVADELYQGRHGFIGLRCNSQSFAAIAQTIIQECGALHKEHPRYRPHIIERWPKLSVLEQGLLREYGTYKIGTEFKPHLSIAQVHKSHVESAYKIAQQCIPVPLEFKIESFQLVDIGHNNESWKILSSWSAV